VGSTSRAWSRSGSPWRCFVALPAAYGVALAVLVERSFRRPAAERWWSVLVLAVLLPFPVLFGLRNPLLIAPVLAALLGIWLASRGRGLRETWRSPAVAWPGRIALAALTAFAAAELVEDIAAVL
jgi:hypothetical protein